MAFANRTWQLATKCRSSVVRLWSSTNASISSRFYSLDQNDMDATRTQSTNAEFTSLAFNHIKSEIVQLLNERGFLQQCGDPPHFGVLSLELINNWKSEWWRQVVKDSDFVFGIEREETRKTSESEDIRNLVFDKLADILQKGKRKLPVGVAVNTLTPRGENDTLALFMLVDKSQSKLEFENLIFDQRQLFRKYLRKPAKLAVPGGSSSAENKNRSASSTVVYSHNGDAFDVIEASAFSSDKLSDESKWKNICQSLNDDSPSLFQIKVNVRNLVYATFVDSYHIISFPNYQATLMCIHPYLTPVKVAVAIEGNEVEKLNEVKEYMCALIRRMNLSCWDANKMKLSYSELDLSGVMYVVIITDLTLRDGLVFIKNRDTSIKIEAHITQVTDKLFLYLNPR